MKYPQVVSMPSAVSDWLEEQLEARGIDSVIYTRYILSLLHRDSTDLICPDQDSCFTHSCKEVRKSGASRKRFRRTHDWWTYDQADVDQLKRTAAVECLMSASDQKWGIESLVDELCEKLKEINNDSSADIETVSTTTNYSKTSPQELANQYYAAFPPLTRNSATNSPGVITLIPKWIASPKKKQLRKVDTDHIKARVTGKSRFNYKKSMGYPRKTDGGSDWEFHCVNNVKNKRSPKNNVSQRPVVGNKDLTISINNDMVELPNNVLGNIRGLLDSPEPDTVAAMNSANVHDSVRKSFIPFRTANSSIWSTTQNEPIRNFVSIVLPQYDTRHDFNSNNDFELNGWHPCDEHMAEEKKKNNFFEKLSSNSTNNSFFEYSWNPFASRGECWPSSDGRMAAEKKTNSFFESSSSNNVFQKYSWNPFSYGDKCWSTLDGRMAAEENTNTSLENSSNNSLFPSSSWNPFKCQEKWSGVEPFHEELAMHSSLAKSFQKLNHHKEKSAFSEVHPRATQRSEFGAFGKTSAAHFFKPDAGTGKVEAEKDKEDLLTSVRSHFKPINEKTDDVRGPQYADGTTFVIPSTLDKINYKRSESGTMYIDSEYGFAKKYREYKTESSTHKVPEFMLKFNIRQNDKGCQTDFESSDDDYDDEVEAAFAKKDEPNKYTEDDDSKTDIKDNWMGDSLFSTGSRPSSVMQEIIWLSKTKHCNKCNKDTIDSLGCWNLDKSAEQGGGDIWNGGDVCVSCLHANSGDYKPLNQQQTKLREDISQDADELFSDLRKCITEGMRNSEVSSEVMEPSDRKRRLVNCCEASASWSFASRLKEDHLIQMSTLPTFRSAIL